MSAKHDMPAAHTADFVAPETRYFKTKELFDIAVGQDFIEHANKAASSQRKFLVGLSHGGSPSGAYAYILAHADELKRPDLLRFTFVNSPLRRQRNLTGVLDAGRFLRQLVRRGIILSSQVLGRSLNRDSLEDYAREFNLALSTYLETEGKQGYDYVFLASDPTGRVAGISRKSEAFGREEIAVIVTDRGEKELTGTPWFLQKSRRIAFLATKADKRRPLARLLYRWGAPDQSPSFLRFMPEVRRRMTVFVNDEALTWPQVVLQRETPFGPSTIKVDMAKPFDPNGSKKKPVVLLIHGFLGLNSYDALLTALPSSKFIAAAMHYGSVPNDLPPTEYSKHVVRNIDAVVSYFGDLGHPVYIFDHSMGNIYFLMMERDFDSLPGIRAHLRGRIGANPFFGEEAQHALLGFLDNVILQSDQGFAERTMFAAMRQIIPLDSKVGVRNRSIALSEWLVSRDSSVRERVWKATKARILYLMTRMDSLPDLNRIPIEQALNRLPAKLFAIQVHCAMRESKSFDQQRGLPNMAKHRIPVMILKSQRDGVAKYVPRIYADGAAKVVDVTDHQEKDLFREHLYHMVNPVTTALLIEEFINDPSWAPMTEERTPEPVAVLA